MVTVTSLRMVTRTRGFGHEEEWTTRIKETIEPMKRRDLQSGLSVGNLS
jgi:hypothetical protein